MYDDEDVKLGGGIITVSVLHIIGAVISIIGALSGILMNDTINSQLKTMGMDETSKGQYIFVAILAVVLLAAVILILCKKAIGLYLYGGYVVVNIISTIVFSGFSVISILFSLILPILMVVFVMKKKYIFGFGEKEY